MNDHDPQPGVPEVGTVDPLQMQASSGDPPGSSLQEWTGSRWVVVETLECIPGFECRPLEPTLIQGQYVGQRVLTPAQPLAV